MILRLSNLPCALVLLALACGPTTPSSDCDNADSPPVAGAACEQDGLVCDAGADMCIEHSALACKDGSWTEQVVPAAECETGTPTTGAGTETVTDPTTVTEPTTVTDPTTVTGTTGADAVACGKEVPAEGSPCAVEGEDCAPGASECGAYVGAHCVDGSWERYEVGPGDPDVCGGPVACDPQNLPPEGARCERDGEFCSPGCEDPCQFCNVVKCEGGTWQNLEVFPAECLGCAEICSFVVPAGCDKGPIDQADCVAGCEASEAGNCQIPFHHTLACAGNQPTFSCDEVGHPTVAGCETQFGNFYACADI